MLKIVVLPAPLGPISAWMAPAGTLEADIVHRAQAAEALAHADELETGAAHGLRSANPSLTASHGQMPAGL